MDTLDMQTGEIQYNLMEHVAQTQEWQQSADAQFASINDMMQQQHDDLQAYFMSKDHFTATTTNDCIEDVMYCTEDEVTLAQIEMVHNNEQTGYAQMLQFPLDRDIYPFAVVISLWDYKSGVRCPLIGVSGPFEDFSLIGSRLCWLPTMMPMLEISFTIAYRQLSLQQKEINQEIDIWIKVEGRELDPGDSEDEEFSIEMHHGGFFMGNGVNRAYVDGRVSWFDHCESDSWSLLWVDDFIEELGYEKSDNTKIYWLLPGKQLNDGLRRVKCDADTNSMVALVPRVRSFVLYADHQDIVDAIDLEDVAIIGSDPLRTAVKPSKIIRAKSDGGELTVDKRATDAKIDDKEESRTEDPDFVDSDYEIDHGDDDLFDNCVEGQIELAHNKVEGSDYGSFEDERLMMPDISEEEEEEIKFSFKSFRADVDMETPEFKVSMMFVDAVELRKAIDQYTIKNRVAIKKTRNTKTTIEAKYAEGCPWMLSASMDNRVKCLVVREYIEKHTCTKQWEIKAVTAKYLAKRYIEEFRDNDKMTLMSFAKKIQKELHLTPSRHKLGRARRMAMRAIYGDEISQYNQLCDYGQELRTSNPGSSFYLNLHFGCFHTLYMSFDACKRGFMSGCRPIICLDGCHIKTKFGGHILTAVDLGIENTSAWTVMTDRQKGLVPAVRREFSHAEQRFCVRHLYQNFQVLYKGETLKNQLWAIARSSTVPEWNANMEKMKALSSEAYKYLEEIPPNQWCRAFFSDFPKCDILLNNNSEVFNKYILDAREMPILSMLERIRNQIMNRLYTKQKELERNWPCGLCPKIKRKVEKNTEMANTCYVLPTGMGAFQEPVITQAASNHQERVNPGAVPETAFIATNRREGVQPPLTTSTKQGRATLRKRSAAPKKKNSPKKKKQ
uniref:MuDR family transposase, putative n=3 Tax=Oryza sativa subsp. japonica TaxID=39947 RepID=A0A5S6R9K0_ORYSJ|nr:MuDR family transposase, putative [Oryza sativa Japonica Group]ABA92642.2 transposon protein, putative, Mutator sub-class [Oryza sativa Japonica Group]